jgi:hypothetical protein
MSRRILLALSLIATAALVRLFPHAPNFAPLGAIGLFGAAYFRRSWGLIIPFAALFLSDLVLNNLIYQEYFPTFTWFTSAWVYVSFAAVIAVGLGMFSGKVTAGKVVATSLTASGVFFLVSNFSTFVETTLYPKTFAGLMMCYTAGLPYLTNTVLSDLAYSALMFGLFEWATRNSKVMASSTNSTI